MACRAAGTYTLVSMPDCEISESSGMRAPLDAHSPRGNDETRSTMSGGLPPLIAVRIFELSVTGTSSIVTFG